jgi:two-component system cell cycle sensor histidine kinase/response regulator CckA
VVAPRILDLNPVLFGLEAMLHPLIGEDVLLEWAPASNPCLVRIDPSQLEQILVNLVVNAREAMPQGGKVTITTALITLDEEWVRDHPYAHPGEYARLTVRDTGRGMDEETIRQVFEPFYTTKSYGSGLGLATVYGIVKQNDGFIEVESAPGAGAAFHVLLPLVRTAGERGAAGEVAPTPTGGG